MNTKKVFGILLMILLACAAASAQCTRCGSSWTVTPTSLNFGSETIGTSKALSIAIIDRGGSIPITGITVVVSGPPAFSLTNSCPTKLTVGQSCHIKVTFAPKLAKSFSGTITIHSSTLSSTVPLAGIGVK